MLNIKLVIGLGVGLLLSIGGNLLLAHKLINAGTACETKIAEARSEAAIAALTGRNEMLGQQIQLVAADRTELLTAMGDVAARQDATLARLRSLIGELPVPTCGPGRDRVEAWNSIGRGDP